jgi:hypothetical protein
MLFRISADIRYLTGALAGLTIPDGHAVTEPTRTDAMRVVRFLSKVRTDGDFIRSVTGNRYEVVSEIRIEEIG